MSDRLAEELKQGKPFASAEQEAFLSLERTAAVVGHAFSESLKQYGVTRTQYNVLRILRGAGEAGLCRHEIWSRMINQVPDVTRLLDRLESAGLIERERSAEDRRLVRTRITGPGLRLLAEMDEPVDALHRKLLGHLAEPELRALIELLERARTPV